MKNDAPPPLPDDLADLLQAEREIESPDAAAYDRVYGQLAAAIPGLVGIPGPGSGTGSGNDGAPPDGTGSPGAGGNGGSGGGLPGAVGAGAVAGAGLKAKLAIATVAALVGAGGGAATHAWVARPAAPPIVASASPGPSATSAVLPPAASVVATEPTTETPTPSASTVPSSKLASSTAPRHEGAGASSLRDERLLIETASTALARGDAASAIATLKKHAATYPRGDLAQEREVLWVRALRASGNDAAAQERARAFRRNYPSSLQQSAMDRAARGE